MPTTNSWNNRCDLLTGSSTVKATHPRGNLRRDNGPLSLAQAIAFVSLAPTGRFKAGLGLRIPAYYLVRGHTKAIGPLVDPW
jgi:hypothetical protein